MSNKKIAAHRCGELGTFKRAILTCSFSHPFTKGPTLTANNLLLVQKFLVPFYRDHVAQGSKQESIKLKNERLGTHW